MSATPSPRHRLLSIVGPALGVLLAYHLAFYRPLKASLQAERTKLNKIEATMARKINLEANKAKLAAAQAELDLLASQLESVKQSGSHLVSRRDDMRIELLESRSPALVMAEALSLLSRHDLECIDRWTSRYCWRSGDQHFV